MSSTKENEHQPFLQYCDDEATDEPESHRQNQYKETRRNKLLSHSLVFIITSLLWMILLYVISSPSQHQKSFSTIGGDHQNITSNAKLITCGKSPLEARALGCKYDVLLNHWVPAQYLDQEFIAEYQDDGTWGAFTDQDLTQQLTAVGEMSEREFYYTSFRDHINHCGIMWKKQFWALFEERPTLDSLIVSPGHTDHCAQFLMDLGEMDWA